MGQYPEIGEEFDLTLDGNDPKAQPLVMVENHGFGKWKHDGPLVKGRQTQKFKLIQKGGSWKEIGGVVGNDLSGQWLGAFWHQFPESDGEHLVGVHDASWMPPYGSICFPYVDRHYGGRLGFQQADYYYCGRWLWLVLVK